MKLELSTREFHHLLAILEFNEIDYINEINENSNDDFYKNIVTELLSDTQSILKKLNNLKNKK